MFFLILLCNLFFVISSQCPKHYRIVMLSDAHINAVKVGCSPANDNVNEVIDEINEAVENDESILFAVVLGDICEDNIDAYYAKGMLDKLNIPVIPIIGNHDIMDVENEGAVVFLDGFDEVFDKLKEDGWIKHETRDKPVYVDDKYWHTVNYELRVPGFDNELVFLVVDFTQRLPNIEGEMRRNAEANLHDYEGGTLDWIGNRIEELTKDEKIKHIVFLQHHPYYTYQEPPLSGLLFKDEDYSRVAEVYKEKAGENVKKLHGNFCGHLHSFDIDNPFGENERIHPEVVGLEHFTQYMMDDLKCIVNFQIVDVNLMEGADLFTITKNSFPKPIQYGNLSCNGKGKCSNGDCLCFDGWKGNNCSEEDTKVNNIFYYVGIPIIAICFCICLMLFIIVLVFLFVRKNDKYGALSNIEIENSFKSSIELDEKFQPQSKSTDL